MDQPPQDPTQPVQPPPAPAPPGPSWGQPAAPPPQQYAPPPQPAPGGWAQPAPGATGWVVPVAAARGPVTGLAKISGLILLLFGLLWTGIGALFVLGGAAAKVGSGGSGVPAIAGLGNAVGDFIAGFGIVILVIAIIEILAGIGVLLSREWGRIIGICYALIFGFGSIFIVAGGANANNVSTDTTGGGVALIIGLVFLLGYAYTLVVLMARWRSRVTA